MNTLRVYGKKNDEEKMIFSTLADTPASIRRAKQQEHHEKKCFFCGDVASATPVYAIDGCTSNGIIVCEHCLVAIRDIVDEKLLHVPKERIRINRMYSYAEDTKMQNSKE